MKKLLLVLFVFVIQQRAVASLSPTDHDLMTTNLEILASGWVQSSVNICNNIILNPNYTSNDWREFFHDYYADHLLTEELWSYLGYPMFWWFDSDTNYKLQRSHQLIFLQQTDDLLARTDLSAVLANQPAEREHLFSMLKVLNLLAAHEKSVLSAAQQDAILQEEENWINQYAAFYKRGNHLDPHTQPFRALIGLQLHITLLAGEELTADRIAELNQLFGFSGMYTQLFLNHGIYIADNERMSDADLHYLDEFFSQLPDPMAPLNLLSNYDYYYTAGQPKMPIDATLIWAVNTFSTVGGYSANSFPSDISPRYIDGFSVVVAHETTHIIDAAYLATDAGWVARKAQLLAQAGDTDLEYLRSMIGADYFQNAPQEFLASIGNEWFTSSEHTLQLGLLRFDNGYREPINQFLFFCELFSLGGNTLPFYTIDTDAQITVDQISGERDPYGHLNRLTVGDVTYHFELDPDGNVLDWNIDTSPGECMISNLTAGAQTACDPSTNTYSQEIILTYAHAPETGVLQVNGQSFPIEQSPQSATLSGLVAHGQPVDVTAFFSDAADCSASASALFTAPAACPPSDPAVTSFVLVNALTDQDILPLTDGATLDAGTLPDQLNIRAVTDPATVGSVVLLLSGCQNVTRTENVAPYALFGDSGGNYNGQSLPPGAYNLTATPYSGSGGSGVAGVSLTISFLVVSGEELPAGWLHTDIGSANGDAGFDHCTESFQVEAYGFSTLFSDTHHAAYVGLCGDGELTAYVAGLSGDGWAGIELRENNSPGSKKAALKARFTNFLQRELRSQTNGPDQAGQLFRPNHRWLRLVRQGNDFYGYSSLNGQNWELAFYRRIIMSDCINAALFAESIHANVLTTATFSDVTVTAPAGMLAAGSGQLLPAARQPAKAVLAVYPNPSSGEVFLDLAGLNGRALTIEVLDNLGRPVLVRELESEALPTQRLDLSGQAPGVYLIRLHSGTESLGTQRVVIDR